MAFILGVDGGGSRTRAVVCDASGRLFGAGEAGPSNIHAGFRDSVAESLRHCIESALDDANLAVSDIEAAVFGMAGAGRPKDLHVYEDIAEDVLPGCNVTVVTDAQAALDAATQGGPGVILLAGTGSACFGTANGTDMVRAGGYGHIVADEGSAYWIGVRALRACLLAADGRGAPTLMRKPILDYLRTDSEESIPVLLRLGLDRPRIAGIAEIVMAHAFGENDSVAATIVDEAAAELSSMVRAVLAKLPKATPVFLSGGLFVKSARFVEDVSGRVRSTCPDSPVSLTAYPPVAGACWRAASMLPEAGKFRFSDFKALHPEPGRDETIPGLPVTEMRNQRSMSLSCLSGAEIARIMNSEDRLVAPAVGAWLHEIGTLIEWAASSYQSGGRLIYVGAGTSGRLGYLDASECPPTFGVSRETVVPVLAGGAKAMEQAVEGAEDDALSGAREMDSLKVSARDTVVGIAASGVTPFTLGAIRRAKELGARTAALTSVPGSDMASAADISISPVVGPEVITGSTRLKCATAHKMILNMISTGCMVRSGKVFQNLMVDVKATNDKLRKRAVRIVRQASGVSETAALELLSRAGVDVKKAVVMALSGVDAEKAAMALKQAGGYTDKALVILRGRESGSEDS